MTIQTNIASDNDRRVRERCADHLIDRDDYFALTNPEKFLDWAISHYEDFYELVIENGDWEECFQIDAMFDHWKSIQ